VDWQTCTVRGVPGRDGQPEDRTVVLGDPLAPVSAELDDLLVELGGLS
jgi:hypothetical protein